MFLDRFRRNVGQRAVADGYGVGLHTYRAWEDDVEVTTSCPKVVVGRIEPHERCRLLRRREGLEADEVAEAIGVSRWWLRRMERGDAPLDRLFDYWGIEG